MAELRQRPVGARLGQPLGSSASIRSDTDTDTELDTLCLEEEDEPDAQPERQDTAQGDTTGAKDAHSEGENKLVKLAKRLIFGTLMLATLCGIVSLGHLATLGLVLFVQILMFRELVNVRYRNRHIKHIPLFRTTQWGWFYTCLLYTYGNAFSEERAFSLLREGVVKQLLPYVEFISLGLYSFMLMTVVLTLQKGYYKYQMGQLAWTIAIIVVTVVQVNSFTQNILNGLFWFLFPVSLVICNDSMAYFSGMAFGRKLTTRRFVGISPNKTWEGFIGGGVCTVIFAFFFPLVLVRYQFMVCPCEELFGSLFELRCKTPQVFLPTRYALPRLLTYVVGAETVTLLPIQIHGLFLGTFASIVAPFGGLFASGIKRAYKLKDFSSIIPGHGGVYDRVDCQLIMGLATQIYFTTFIGSSVISRQRVLQLISTLATEEQLLLHKELGDSLRDAGLRV